MRYDEEARERIIDQMKDKVIKNVQYVESEEAAGPNPYWVMELSDGSEMCFKFMTEIYDVLPRGV